MQNALDIKNAIQRLYHNNVTIKALVVVSKDGKVTRLPSVGAEWAAPGLWGWTHGRAPALCLRRFWKSPFLLRSPRGTRN